MVISFPLPQGRMSGFVNHKHKLLWCGLSFGQVWVDDYLPASPIPRDEFCAMQSRFGSHWLANAIPRRLPLYGSYSLALGRRSRPPISKCFTNIFSSLSLVVGSLKGFTGNDGKP